MQSIWKINRGRRLFANAGGNAFSSAANAHVVTGPKWGLVVEGHGISQVHISCVAGCATNFFRSFSAKNTETSLKETPSNVDTEKAMGGFSKLPSKKSIFKVWESMGPMSAKEFIVWEGKQMGNRPKGYLHNVFFENCLRARKFELALEVLQEMRENGVPIRPHLYNLLASYYLKAGMTAEAEEALNKMKLLGFSPTIRLYRFLINDGLVARDMEYIGRVLQTFSRVEDFNAALQVCARASKARLALKVLESMEKMDCVGNMRTYELLARCLCKAKRMENALKFLERLKENGLIPDHSIYNKLVSYLFSEKREEEALKLLSYMKDNGCQANMETNFILIKGYLDSGQAEKARALLGEMEEDGCVPTPEVLALFSKAEREVRNMVSSDNSSETTAKLPLPSLEDEESDSTYKRILGIIEGKPWDAETETALRGYLNKLTKKMVCKLVLDLEIDAAKTFVTWAAQQEGYSYSNSGYYALLKTLMHTGKFDSAVEVLKEMKGKGMWIHPSSIALFISGCGKFGKMAVAEEVLELSLGGNLGARVCGAFLDGYLQAGDPDGAAKLVQSLSGVKDFNAAIAAYGRAGKADSALEVLEIMEKKGCSANLQTYNVLVGWMCRAGRLEEAWTVLENMQKNGLVVDVKLYNNLISHFCQQKRVDEALKLITKMREAGCQPDIRTHNSLISGFFESGQAEKVQQYIEEMKAGGCMPSQDTTSLLVVNLSMSDQVKKAVEEFEAAAEKNEKFSPDACCCLLKALIKEGKLEEALKIFKRMKEGAGHVDKSAYIVMLRGCCNVYRFDIMDKLQAEMRVKGMELPVSTYVLLLQTYSRAMKFKEVIALFEDSQKKGFELGGSCTASAVLDALNRAHQLDLGVKFCENLAESGAKVNSRQLKHFLRLLVRTGRAGEAGELMKVLSNKGCIVLERSQLEMA